MLRIVLWRLAFAVPLLLAVTAAMFALAANSPFDPVRQYLGDRAMVTSPEVVARIRAEWGPRQAAARAVRHLARQPLLRTAGRVPLLQQARCST
ncbi:hypothetical protein [Nonomuraea dietziae]|uniref:hypothetical protein n=1 Tax=Nonomuraea dietziae TaxID=65515 RepID=UPI0031DEACEA